MQRNASIWSNMPRLPSRLGFKQLSNSTEAVASIIPLTDNLLMSLLIVKHSFTAFVTCLTMIFLLTNVVSFSSNSNAPDDS